MPRWASQYPAAPTSAAPGNVRTQAYTIRRAQIHRTACQPRVAPTPEIAPAIACVVEMGTEARVASPIVVAAANSAENPPIGRRWGVIRDPMVFTIRHPPSIVKTMWPQFLQINRPLGRTFIALKTVPKIQ